MYLFFYKINEVSALGERKQKEILGSIYYVCVCVCMKFKGTLVKDPNKFGLLDSIKSSWKILLMYLS